MLDRETICNLRFGVHGQRAGSNLTGPGTGRVSCARATGYQYDNKGSSERSTKHDHDQNPLCPSVHRTDTFA